MWRKNSLWNGNVLITLSEWMGNISLILSNIRMSLRRINSNSFNIFFPSLSLSWFDDRDIAGKWESNIFLLSINQSSYFWIVSSSTKKYLKFDCTSPNPVFMSNKESNLLASFHPQFFLSIKWKKKRKHLSFFSPLDLSTKRWKNLFLFLHEIQSNKNCCGKKWCHILSRTTICQMSSALNPTMKQHNSDKPCAT